MSTYNGNETNGLNEYINYGGLPLISSFKSVEEKFDYRDLIKKYQLFKVVSVDDNRKGGLQHYKIGVSE